MAFQDLHKVIDGITEILFRADTRRLTAWVDKLCDDNQEIKGKPCAGFLYGGVFYRKSTITGQIPRKEQIDPSLFKRVDQFLVDKKATDNDKAFVKQALCNLLWGCRTQQDVRDTLPDSLVACCGSSIQSLERTRPVAFTLQDNSRALRQFHKIAPKLEVYAAARLIY